MKFALTHLWSSLKNLAKDSPLLLILIILFSCTPFYINTDWFAQINTIFYIMYSVIIILQSYITRERRYSLLFTIVSIIIAAGLHTIYKTYQDIPGIKMAIENMTALWLYSMITLYFTSADGHYIGGNHQSAQAYRYHHRFLPAVQHHHCHEFVVLIYHFRRCLSL